MKADTNHSGITARSHQTQWSAQFAVASELCKRDYEVAFTSGHTTPTADLMVVSPKNKTPFLVDVKGLYRKNPWIVRRKPRRDDLYYVLAYVPEGEANQFFVLNHEQVLTLIQQELTRLRRLDSYPVTGFVWKLAEPYRDKWKALPQ